MKYPKFIWIMVAASLLAGCQSLTDRRIAAHQKTWRTLSAQDQHRLRAGHVLPGDSEEMVRIAFGTPDNVQTISGRDGEQQTVWFYDRWDSSGDFFLNSPGAAPQSTSHEDTVIFRDGIVVYPGTIADGGTGKLRELQAARSTEMMATRLDRLVTLTSEQMAKARVIFTEANEQLYALDPGERPEQGRPIRVRMRADIRAILTPAQQVKYDTTPQYLGGGSTKRQ